MTEEELNNSLGAGPACRYLCMSERKAKAKAKEEILNQVQNDEKINPP